MNFETGIKAGEAHPLTNAVQVSVASALRAARERAGLVSILALCSVAHGGMALAADDDVVAANATTAAADTTTDTVGIRDSLQEVVVSATHRDTTVQDTPISISAVTSETLTSSGVSSMQDLAALVPNMRMQGGRDGGGRINMRGIAAPSGEATVGLYYMDVPMSGPSDTSQTSGSFTQEANLFDVQRIEALSGPQGTLYGAGAMGGTVRVLFNKADTHATSGTIDTSASAINHGGLSYWVKGMYNVPIIEDLFAARVALWREHRGGYVDNDWVFRGSGWGYNPGLGLGANASTTPSAYCASPPCTAVPGTGQSDVNTGDIQGGRIMLRWTPTDWLAWDGIAMWQKTASITGAWDTYYPWNATRPDGSTYQTNGKTPVPTNQSYTVYSPVLGQQQDNFLMVSSPFKFTLPYVDLDLISSYYNWNRSVGGNYSDNYTRNSGSASLCSSWLAGGQGTNVYQPLPSAKPACTSAQQAQYADYVANKLNPSDLVKPNTVKSFINEFRISSNYDGALQWLLGVYNERRKDRVDSTEGQVTSKNGLVSDLNDFPVYWWRWITDDIKQTAYFANLTWKPGLFFAPGFGIDLGIRRFTYEKYTFGGVVMNGYGDGNFVADPAVSPQFSGSGSSANGWLPKYTANYTFSKDLMVYGTISKGYRPGGANVIPAGQLPPGTSGQFLVYQPDTVWNFELGEKSSWLANTLTLNASVYRLDWSNMQTSLTTPNNCCAYVGNAGNARVEGTEWTLTWLPIHGLTLTAGLSDNWEAELTSNQSADGVAPTNTQGHKGDPIPYIAKLNGSLDTEYKYPIGDAVATIRLNYAYTGSSRTKLRPVQADPQSASIGGFGTLNLRVGAEKDGWQAYLFINNLTGRIGIMDNSISAAYSSANGLGTVNQYYLDNRVTTTVPREAGFNIRKEF